jgi:hypothetical protein
MQRPTFLILGTSRAGSTSLYHYLSQHPDVFMSEPKEPRFFFMEYKRGPDYYWQSYFKAYGGQKEIGDGCTKNLYLPFVAQRIADTLPEARLFVLCRDPAERALSAYWHAFNIGLEPLSLEAAIEKNLRRLETGPRFENEAEASLFARVAHQGNKALHRAYGFYLEPGHYAEHIERYRGLFDQERIKIIFFEDLTHDTAAAVADAQRFLGLEPRPLSEEKVHNQTMSRPAAMFCLALSNFPGIRRIPSAWRAEVKRRIAHRFGYKASEVSASTRRILVEHFRPHNERLARLTGRSLEHWNQPAT